MKTHRVIFLDKKIKVKIKIDKNLQKNAKVSGAFVNKQITYQFCPM